MPGNKFSSRANAIEERDKKRFITRHEGGGYNIESMFDMQTHKVPCGELPFGYFNCAAPLPVIP